MDKKIQVGQKTVDFKLVNCNSVMKHTDLILKTYGGCQIKLLCVVDLDCKLGNVKKLLEFVIADL